MSIDERWTLEDDEWVRSALSSLHQDVTVTPLAGTAFIRARGTQRRRRRILTWTSAAAVIAAIGLGYGLAGRGHDTPPPIPATPTMTQAPTPSRGASPTPTPTPSATPVETSTRVIGDDGALGPFRIGMTRAEVEAAIRDAGLTGRVTLESTELGGQPPKRTIIAEKGADTGFGTQGLLGVFDAGCVDLLFPPTDATIHGLGVGDPVTAFQREFPGQVAESTVAPGLFIVTLDNGIRLQLGSPLAVNTPEAIGSLTILPPGDRLFGEFA